MNKVKRYIEVCHTCLKTKPKYKKNRPVYGRIPVDYTPMQDLSIDIKMMPQAFGGYNLLLIITCNQTNFTITVPLSDRQTHVMILHYSTTLTPSSKAIYSGTKYYDTHVEFHSLSLDVSSTDV